MRLALATLLLASAAQAQSPADILAQNAGFETGQQLAEQDPAFSFDRFRDGFEAGLRGDSVEIAYALGLRAGLGLRADTTTRVDPDLFTGGIRAGLRGDPPPYTQEQITRATVAFQEDVTMRQLQAQTRTNPKARRQIEAIRVNGEASALFLAEVEHRPGVRKTATGVLYRITTPGHGASPTNADQVEIEYIGRLADGTVFDRSPEGQPMTLPVYAVVPGFSEVLRAMMPGETRTAWIPANLAYGLQGAPPHPGGTSGEGGIPPNSALEFEITLVRILEAPVHPLDSETEPDFGDPPPPPPAPPRPN